MVPIGSVATFSDKTGPYRVVRYNLQPAVEIDGDTAPGYSTGQSLATMEKLAETLPAGYGGDWTDIAYQQSMPATPPVWSSAWLCSSSSWCWPPSMKALPCLCRSS
jgi:multidrug efflux pump subunit AcrB